MSGLKKILAAVTAILSVLSCTKQNREMEYNGQEAKIESFVNSQLSSKPGTRVEYNGGSVRIILNEGEGVELNARGRATVFFAGYDFSGGSINSSGLFATNNYEFAMSSNWELSDSSIYEPLVMDLTDRSILEGLRTGLEGVKEGEECYILFSGKYAFGKNKYGTIPANAPLAFRIWVQEIEN